MARAAHLEASAPAAPAAHDSRSPAEQAYRMLRAGFVAAPVLAGADELLHLLTDWDAYFARARAKASPLGAHALGGR